MIFLNWAKFHHASLDNPDADVNTGEAPSGCPPPGQMRLLYWPLVGLIFDFSPMVNALPLPAAEMAGLGIAAGLLIFIYVFPGTPKIGVIDVPFTVITDDSANVIGEYLNYARKDDSIKAVVIKLSTPGGGAAASERLYADTRRLREEKPVVIVMNGMVASGGYMMSMGASHTFAQTSSLVGNVGVVAFAGPLISPVVSEDVIFTGPYKVEGSTRREWIGSVDLLKSAFAKMVVAERGDKLLISEDELVQGRLYAGLEAERLGLVDEIGSDSDWLSAPKQLSLQVISPAMAHGGRQLEV